MGGSEWKNKITARRHNVFIIYRCSFDRIGQDWIRGLAYNAQHGIMWSFRESCYSQQLHHFRSDFA